MNEKTADLGPRIIAAIIDAVIAWAFSFIPVAGAIIGAGYILLKDALPYQLFKTDEWRNKSFGKKVMNIKVLSLEGKEIDFAVSAKRNIPLSLGNAIAIVPILGWVLGPVVGLAFGIVEIVLILTDNDKRQRLGDRFANTMIVVSEGTAAVTEDTTEKNAAISDEVKGL